MHSSDVVVTKVWWSKKFALRWRYDYLGVWRTADLFDNIRDAERARQEFIHCNVDYS